MKLYDEVTKSKVTKYMFAPKHPAPQHKHMMSHMSDKVGLHRAYDSSRKIYAHGSTLYIAGTASLRDVWDDIKIPLHLTRFSDRYQNASKYLEDHKNIKSLVGHSLGGSVALELQKDFPDRKFKSNTYGAPVASLSGADNRFRNYFDPVSILDRGADNTLHMGFNPHSFVILTPTEFQIKPSKPLPSNQGNNNNKSRFVYTFYYFLCNYIYIYIFIYGKYY